MPNKMSNDKERVSIVIPKDYKNQLQEIAKKDERSINYLITKAIELFLEEHKED